MFAHHERFTSIAWCSKLTPLILATQEAEIRKITFFFFAVPRLELKAYTLSHSTSPVFVKGFLR
jgi:hypothetical protein